MYDTKQEKGFSSEHMSISMAAATGDISCAKIYNTCIIFYFWYTSADVLVKNRYSTSFKILRSIFT